MANSDSSLLYYTSLCLQYGSFDCRVWYGSGRKKMTPAHIARWRLLCPFFWIIPSISRRCESVASSFLVIWLNSTIPYHSVVWYNIPYRFFDCVAEKIGKHFLSLSLPLSLESVYDCFRPTRSPVDLGVTTLPRLCYSYY